MTRWTKIDADHFAAPKTSLLDVLYTVLTGAAFFVIIHLLWLVV